MPLNDPPRLLDPGAAVPEAVRDGLEAARGDLPRGDQLARLAARLPMGGARPPGGSGASPQGGGVPAPPLGPIASLLPAAGIGALLAIGLLGVQALLAKPAPTSIPSRDPAPFAAVAPRAVVAGFGSATPQAQARSHSQEDLSPKAGGAAPFRCPHDGNGRPPREPRQRQAAGIQLRRHLQPRRARTKARSSSSSAPRTPCAAARSKRWTSRTGTLRASPAERWSRSEKSSPSTPSSGSAARAMRARARRLSRRASRPRPTSRESRPWCTLRRARAQHGTSRRNRRRGS